MTIAVTVHDAVADAGDGQVTTNAVPSTAAVAPPALIENSPDSDTLAARFQVLPTVSVPWVWRAPFLSVSLVIANSVARAEARERAVGVGDLGA